jgi:tetratricopeptide (TPR) repeat protein
MNGLLRDFTSMTQVLPAQVNGLIAVAQTRPALQSGNPEWASSLAQTGIAALDHNVANAVPVPEYLLCLKATLTALLAIAQKRSGKIKEAERSLDNYAIADEAFTGLIDSAKSTVVPFLGDYLFLLVEFGQAQKAFQITEKLHNIMERLGKINRGAASLAWLRATLLSPTARMVMELGLSLKQQSNILAAAEEFMRAAAIALASKEIEVALQAVDEILSIDPKNADAHRIRGVLRWRNGLIDEAEQDFQAAFYAKPDDLETHLALVKALLTHNRRDDIQEAMDHLNVIITSHPDDSDALWLQGDAQLGLAKKEIAGGRPTAARSHCGNAIHTLDKALRADPGHVQARRSRAAARYYLAMMLEDNQRLDMLEHAWNDTDHVLKLDPNDVDAHGWHAEVLLGLKKNLEAVAAVNMALALIGSDSTLAEKRAWLLGLKGQALLNTEWHDQAIEVLLKATCLKIEDEKLASNLLDAYKRAEHWKALAERAAKLQDNPYRPEFKLHLREEEVLACRNGGDYHAAFKALERRPGAPGADDQTFAWLKARLRADIGDFELGQTILSSPPLPDKNHFTDHLALRAWCIQNQEAHDEAERAAWGEESRGFYTNALEAAPKDRADRVWLRKGIANALRRKNDKPGADKEYRGVIDECQKRVKTGDASPRILALIGWCMHSMGDHTPALRYYEAATHRGERSISVEFDYDLVKFAEAGATPPPEGVHAYNLYQATAGKARKEDVLRRIGMLRIALHDFRELLFVQPELKSQSENIGQLLCMELLGAVEEIVTDFEDLSETIFIFLNVSTTAPLGFSVLMRDALMLRIKACRFIRQKNVPKAIEELQKAADIYGELKQRVWSAKTWQRISDLCRKEDPAQSCRAACEALSDGIYQFDVEIGSAFIHLVTDAALSNMSLPLPYPSLIEKIFVDGPDIAFRDAPRIVQNMSPQAQQLFRATLKKVFRPRQIADKWLLVGEGSNARQIPDTQALMYEFQRLRGRRLASVASVMAKI